MSPSRRRRCWTAPRRGVAVTSATYRCRSASDTCCSPSGATLLAWLSKACPSSSAPDSALSEPFDVEPPYVPDHDALAAVEKYDDRFLDREISWLHFNQRVLELAEDPDLPLLERVRFLAIFASNLDEFFMVRVAGLKRRIAAGVAVRAASGLLPREVLEEIWAGTGELMQRQARPVPRRARAGAPRTRASSWSAGPTWTARSRRRASGSSATASSRC